MTAPAMALAWMRRSEPIERIRIEYGTATGLANTSDVAPPKKVEMRQARTYHPLAVPGASVATLHLMVGLPCSGKTTLARQIENEQSALRLTPDEWQVTLFGQDATEPEHDARHRLIEVMLWDLAFRLLVLGTSVILDYGFWGREEREDLRARAEKLGASSEVHFLDVSEEELLRRLEARNAETPPGAFRIPVAMMKRFITMFQAPTADELARRE
jgi:predicted kinase